MNKTILYQLLALLLLLGITTTSHAQVTIGSGKRPSAFSVLELDNKDRGGLRLPHLTDDERNKLTATSEFIQEKDSLARGLTIYNLTSKCVEYWNATKWISLCTGQAGITFVNENNAQVDITKVPFLSGGEEKGKFTTRGNPDCTGNSEPYSFTVLTGATFTQVTVTNVSTGEFIINMNANMEARPRTAVLRVTNNCTTEYSEFILMQAGADVCEPGITTPPTIVSTNGTVICGKDGSVYLTIDHAVTPTKEYIWTLNDAEIAEARGKKYHIATQAGIYRVYIGGVGCDDNASARVTVSMNSAGDMKPVGSIYATNSGVICGSGNTIITALTVPLSGTLTWYKNGKAEPSKTGNPISLGTGDVGDWFAVMSDGAACISKASNVVRVQAEPTSTPLPTPDVYINNKPLDAATFCKNGYLSLKLNNKAAYDALGIGITVRWYNDNSLLGAGDDLTIVAPAGDEFLLRCVVSDNTGANCAAEAIKSKTMTAVAPSRPIVMGIPALICGANAANLIASGGQVGYTYQWFKAGSAIAGKTEADYSPDQPGFYTVQMTTAEGCVSPMSAPTEVDISDTSVPQLVSPVTLVEPNSTHTYQVMGSHSPTEYTWSITGEGVLLDAGVTGNMMRVKYNNVTVSSTATLSVSAKNACGESTPVTQDIDIVSALACIQVSDVATTMSHQGDVPLNATVTMNATAKGSKPFFYQWFKNGAPITGERTTSLYTISGAQASHTGEYSVLIKNECTLSGVKAVAGSIKALDPNVFPTGTGIVSGESYYDLVLSPDNFNDDCGLQAEREIDQANFMLPKVYTFTNSGTANKNLRFMVEGADGLISSITPDPTIPAPAVNLTDGGKYTVSLKFDKAKVETAGYGTTNDNAIKLKVIALYDVGGVTNKSVTSVEISDCDCSSVTDISGNTYTAAMFGTGGCWMTENLAVTKYADGTNVAYQNPGNALPHSKGGLALGYHYYQSDATRNKWTSNNGTSTIQGVCPDGWVVPSVSDYARLIIAISDKVGAQTHTIAGAVVLSAADRSTLTNWLSTSPSNSVSSNAVDLLVSQKPLLADLKNGKSRRYDDKGFDLIKGGIGGNQSTSSQLMNTSIRGSNLHFMGGTNINFYNGTSYSSPVRCKRKK